MELRRYWEVLWGRKILFGFVFSVIVIVTLVWALAATPVYMATTRVVVRTQDLSTDISSTTVPVAPGKLYIESQTIPVAIKTLLENKDSISRVIKELNLTQKDGTPLTSIELMKSSFFSIISNKIGLKIKSISDSDVFEIAAYSTSPSMAVKISEAITTTSLNLFANINKEETRKTIEILTKECLRLNVLITNSENNINNYKLNNMAISVDEIATNYASQLVTTKLSIAKLSTEKKENHPDLKVALAQITLIEKEFKKISTKQVELAKLTRINTALVNVYTSLLNDLEKAKVLKALSITNILILEKAQIPEKSKKYYKYFPRRKVMLIFALFIGSFLGMIVVFLAEYIDDTLKNPFEVKSRTGQKVLAVIPQIKGNKLFPPTESTLLVPAMSDLWVSIKISSMNQPKILTITSYGVGEGKSLVTACLGYSLAKSGFKTLLVDLNFKNYFLSRVYNQSSDIILKDPIITVHTQKFDALKWVKTIEDNLYMIPFGAAIGSDKTVLLNIPFLFDLIAQVKKEFDVIIIDTSSLNQSKETLLVAKESEGTILVVEAGKYQVEKIIWSLDELIESRASVVGILLNKKRNTSII
ncbi:MAG: hypothetical protein A2Y79_09825 [Deltaproteobacteria bacterium RBG_13_43_22]|nr:MAG: hypothetical protein A2Y79_09825 [Deltaproteobacteria bacterium RBG_13_43_22]